jgi:hypothetical protein
VGIIPSQPADEHKEPKKAKRSTNVIIRLLNTNITVGFIDIADLDSKVCSIREQIKSELNSVIGRWRFVKYINDSLVVPLSNEQERVHTTSSILRIIDNVYVLTVFLVQ